MFSNAFFFDVWPFTTVCLEGAAAVAAAWVALGTDSPSSSSLLLPLLPSLLLLLPAVLDSTTLSDVLWKDEKG